MKQYTLLLNTREEDMEVVEEFNSFEACKNYIIEELVEWAIDYTGCRNKDALLKYCSELYKQLQEAETPNDIRNDLYQIYVDDDYSYNDDVDGYIQDINKLISIGHYDSTMLDD